jgi:putative endonuclease
MAEHREGLLPGFASRYRIHRLVYYEPYRDVRQAICRETQIKKWRREKKVALIEATNATWDDLAAGWFAPAGKSGSRARADSSRRSE